MKHSKNSADDSSRVFTVSPDDAVTNHSANAHSLSSLSCEEQPSVMTDTHVPFTSEDDMLLKKLKKDSKSWDEIIKCFPGRFKATLQVQ
ncbi:hypothetical protein BDDG_04276 [Blastomyces dermatitidis ATCC 18188]|uniref:Myb-like domain-containing protein n=1 Tax=Ajellomyces dermatitidis (strain ATCC 18188 / CBS 674.68) TaxID=653446 RepID=F2TDM1_AJEDA|nr:hypothetical protein BDDG_04276 [Blastomyces dermatitidis ATCC 18188]